MDCSEDVWDKIFDINVKASFLLAKQAAPLIKERGGGSIVFISSLAGFNPFKVRLNTEFLCKLLILSFDVVTWRVFS